MQQMYNLKSYLDMIYLLWYLLKQLKSNAGVLNTRVV